MNEHSTLLADDQAAWTAAAAAVLRKSGKLAADAPDSDATSRLTRRTVEGVSIPPLGTRILAEGCTTRVAAQAPPGSAPFLRGDRATGGWDVRALIADPDPKEARSSVATALSGGVTSLWLRLGDGAINVRDLPAVLSGVRLDAAPIVLDIAAGTPGSSNAGSDWQRMSAAVDTCAHLADGATGDSGRMHPDSCLGFDPIGSASRRMLGAGSTSYSVDTVAIEEGAIDTVAILGGLSEISAAASRLGIRALVVDGSAVHDVGAGDAQEIGYTLAVGAAYLRALTTDGIPIDAACHLIEFRYAVTNEQFTSIAKLRAARLAWHRVCELSGAAPEARAMRQHAVTSSAMMTRYDRYVNMLRATIATFAAGAGGANSITTLPFDSALRSADEFGQRMARNVSALLIGESHVGAVADPAGGAYAVEMLTADLAEAAWSEFGRMEAAGGVLAALADGSIATRIAETRRERDQRIAHRTQPITGVSEFPDPAESPGAAVDSGSAINSGAADASGAVNASSAPYRWAEPFESLRDSPPPNPLLLVRVGTQAHASARMQFTENLLAAGGIKILRATVSPDPATGDKAAAGIDAANVGANVDNVKVSASGVTAAVRDSGCSTVIFAGSDVDYAGVSGTLISDLAVAARAAGAAAVFLAGRPKRLLTALPDGVIDGAVAVGDDAIELLRTVRATLGAV